MKTPRLSFRLSSEAGVTLLELLLAMTVLSFVILGATAAFLSQNDIVLNTDQIANIQRDARTALRIITNDLAMAGSRVGIVRSDGGTMVPVGISHQRGLTDFAGETLIPGSDVITVIRGYENFDTGEVQSGSTSTDLKIFFVDPRLIRVPLESVIFAVRGSSTLCAFQVDIPAEIDDPADPGWAGNTLSLPVNAYTDPFGASFSNCSAVVLDAMRAFRGEVIRYWLAAIPDPRPGEEGLGQLRIQVNDLAALTLSSNIEKFSVTFLDDAAGVVDATVATNLPLVRMARVSVTGRSDRFERSNPRSGLSLPTDVVNGQRVQWFRRRYERLVSLRDAAPTVAGYGSPALP